MVSGPGLSPGPVMTHSQWGTPEPVVNHRITPDRRVCAYRNARYVLRGGIHDSKFVLNLDGNNAAFIHVDMPLWSPS